MNAWVNTSRCLAVLLLVFVAVGFFLPRQGHSAPPPTSSYTLGPFEAVGVGTSLGPARVAALADMWDQIFGVGGIASQLPAGDIIVSFNIVNEDFFLPEYTIMYEVTIDSAPQGEGAPGGGGPG